MLIVVLISIVTYLYYFYAFNKGLKKNKHNFYKINHKFVSIVIAARNEEKTISNLLTTLVNQSYPDDKYEIIVANDESSDRTEEILKSFSEKFPNIKYFNVTGRAEVTSPKKNALDQAISIAKGSIILSTDADCIVKQKWIETMVSAFDDDIDFVIGYSRTFVNNWNNASILHRFEHFDFSFLMLATVGSAATEKHFGCTGQNLGYKRNSFYEVDGFQNISHLISGDDANLMQLFRQKGKKIRFCFNQESYVYTGTINSWVALINQRNRWASNIPFQFRLNPELFMYLVSVFFLKVGMFYYLFFDPRISVGIFMTKLIADWFYLKSNHNVLLFEKERLKFYPIWFLIQPFFNLFTAILGGFKIFRWEVKR